jgi:type I restriction enzyme R subunit
LEFVLAQYVSQGEGELHPDKLPNLLTLKYGTPADAVANLGSVPHIRQAFRSFQQDLYGQD